MSVDYSSLGSLVGYHIMYDSEEFAESYVKEKETHPFRTDMERYSLLSWLGSVKGKRILDLACGGGNYSRMFCQLGASEVVGVDASRDMIDSALRHTPESMPVSYVVEKAEAYTSHKPFDLVFHAYLLNHADSRKQLQGLCRSFYRQLSAGGQMLGIMGMLGHQSAGTSPSGCRTEFEGALAEGDSYRLFFPGQQSPVVNHNWNRSSYHSSLLEAGFSNLCWYLPTDNRSQKFSVEDWVDLENDPVFLGVSATRG